MCEKSKITIVHEILSRNRKIKKFPQTIGDLGDILGLSRQTVYCAFNGRNKKAMQTIDEWLEKEERIGNNTFTFYADDNVILDLLVNHTTNRVDMKITLRPNGVSYNVQDVVLRKIDGDIFVEKNFSNKGAN